MSQSVVDLYWKPAYRTYYEAYFQELASEGLVSRWQKIDIVTAFLVAVTASSSAIAGWALWNAPGWKLIWVTIAGTATLASVGHGVMSVPRRVKEQEDLRRSFCLLRVEIETFLQQLTIGINGDEAKIKHEELRQKFAECMRPTQPDIAYTRGFRRRVGQNLNTILKEKEYIE